MIRRLIQWALGPSLNREMDGWKTYLDLQHGIKYNMYADSLQASVNRLKSHVDGISNTTAQVLIEMQTEMREARECDRKTILKLRERIEQLEQAEMESGRRTRPVGSDLRSTQMVLEGL